MRLAGYCLLHLRSSEPSLETVILYAIPNLEQLADTLREASLHERTPDALPLSCRRSNPSGVRSGMLADVLHRR